jgi:hypothetical protein
LEKKYSRLNPIKTQCAGALPATAAPGRALGGRKQIASATAASEATAIGTMNNPRKSVAPPTV